ncbi:MAG: lysylphosphatidylglycerol synthetase family protein [Polaromonas sp.]|nr:lysylphosphatidylglycerol synthetase family protein [Polaromonas sp.]
MPLWKKVRRWAFPVFGIAVLGLLISHAHKVDWAGAWQALRQTSPWLLLAVLGLATASHALYGCYDLIGRYHTRHRLPRWETWAIALTSYAFTLNLGSLIGGVATRARLYARSGLDEATIAQVIGISAATNWLGYGLVAGSLFASGAVAPPPQAHMATGSLQALGVGMLLLAAAYVAACKVWQGRQWQVRGRRIRLPRPDIAIMQLCMSSANWALMGAAIYLLLGRQVPYGTALGVLMAASIAGVVMPLPGGIGVLEAVYLALLSGRVGQGTVMGAVLAYRALYYFLPLAGALAMYALLERYAASHPPAAPPGTRLGAEAPSAG